MDIKFRQSGGIAGLVEGCDLNEQLLSVDDSDTLQRLVLACDIYENFEKFATDARDATEFLIEIDDDKGHRSLIFDELNIPKSCEALLMFLRTKSGFVQLD